MSAEPVPLLRWNLHFLRMWRPSVRAACANCRRWWSVLAVSEKQQNCQEWTRVLEIWWFWRPAKFNTNLDSSLHRKENCVCVCVCLCVCICMYVRVRVRVCACMHGVHERIRWVFLLLCVGRQSNILILTGGARIFGHVPWEARPPWRLPAAPCICACGAASTTRTCWRTWRESWHWEWTRRKWRCLGMSWGRRRWARVRPCARKRRGSRRSRRATWWRTGARRPRADRCWPGQREEPRRRCPTDACSGCRCSTVRPHSGCKVMAQKHVYRFVEMTNRCEKIPKFFRCRALFVLCCFRRKLMPSKFFNSERFLWCTKVGQKRLEKIIRHIPILGCLRASQVCCNCTCWVLNRFWGTRSHSSLPSGKPEVIKNRGSLLPCRSCGPAGRTPRLQSWYILLAARTSGHVPLFRAHLLHRQNKKDHVEQRYDHQWNCEGVEQGLVSKHAALLLIAISATRTTDKHEVTTQLVPKFASLVVFFTCFCHRTSVGMIGHASKPIILSLHASQWILQGSKFPLNLVLLARAQTWNAGTWWEAIACGFRKRQIKWLQSSSIIPNVLAHCGCHKRASWFPDVSSQQYLFDKIVFHLDMMVCSPIHKVEFVHWTTKINIRHDYERASTRISVQSEVTFFEGIASRVERVHRPVVFDKMMSISLVVNAFLPESHVSHHLDNKTRHNWRERDAPRIHEVGGQWVRARSFLRFPGWWILVGLSRPVAKQVWISGQIYWTEGCLNQGGCTGISCNRTVFCGSCKANKRRNLRLLDLVLSQRSYANTLIQRNAAKQK